MKRCSRSIAVLSLFCGTMLVAGVPPTSTSSGSGYQQYPPQYGPPQYSPTPEGLRDLVARTQEDIRRSEHFVQGEHHQLDRCRDAEKNLSTFDRHLTKGHYDKGGLDHVIGDVQGILDHNTLQAEMRDALLRDAEDLRAARARHY
ncbi:MAG: hypothetical protein JO033_06245 [Acidobacteriaceae bacterium]|nr:hypothetical protein [Acidobacteriaceae bacterium]MBV9502217.1 hypothetical protein [Acidobacteriaceae bacterium]